VRSILLATSNPGKLREIRQVLGDLPVEIVSLADVPPIDEPVEDGDTFAANAGKKALHYAARSGLWALADDSGLAVDALGGEPGVHSARYAADRCDANAGRDVIDSANNQRLLEELADVPDEQRTARFVCHLVLAEPAGVLLETSGVVEGRIGHEPQGDNGFGYDPLFVLPDRGCTTAQLSPDEKNAISHRGTATRQFKAMLADLLTSMD
jgi:XTP/dITP diphosphohydrolase